MLISFDILSALIESMKVKFPDFIRKVKKTKDYNETSYYNIIFGEVLIPNLDQVESDLAEGKISDYKASETAFIVSHELGHVSGAILAREAFTGVDLTDFIRAVEEIIAEGISRLFREKACDFDSTFNLLNSLYYQSTWYSVIRKKVPDKGTRIKLISKIRDLIYEGCFILRMALASKNQLEVEVEEEKVEVEDEENE